MNTDPTIPADDNAEPDKLAEAILSNLAELVDSIGLSEADKRILAGHDEPDPGCIIEGVGRVALAMTYGPDLPLFYGAAMARLSPEGMKALVDQAVATAAEHMLLDVGLDLSELGGAEGERRG
ncbi:hypothetical protein [Plantactinospora sp. WMMB782]|uniref:hypothetical protein n=1 Tax=Plantactinospora sp. WMMB782 TaxID=3404121 RepID=UPI003B959525